MKKKLALLGVAAVVLGMLPGCQLCLLPCYICALASSPNTNVSAAQHDEEDLPLAEVGPQLQREALKAAVAH